MHNPAASHTSALQALPSSWHPVFGASKLQPDVQQRPEELFPSSHCSNASTTPLPHVVMARKVTAAELFNVTAPKSDGRPVKVTLAPVCARHPGFIDVVRYRAVNG